MPHNERGDSSRPDTGRIARPAFMALPERNRPVGPPPCRWDALGGEFCNKPSYVSGNSTHFLCLRHARDVAQTIGYTSRDAARADADREVQHKVDMMKRELARLHARLAQTVEAPKERAKRDPDAPGTIYFLRSGAYFKIGWTGSLEQRMKGYPPDTQLLAAQPGTQKQERALHRRFGHLLGRGREWFVMAPEIEDHIDRVVAEHGPAPVLDFTAKRNKRTAGRQKQYVGGNNRGPMLPKV